MASIVPLLRFQIVYEAVNKIKRLLTACVKGHMILQSMLLYVPDSILISGSYQCRVSISSQCLRGLPLGSSASQYSLYLLLM